MQCPSFISSLCVRHLLHICIPSYTSVQVWCYGSPGHTLALITFTIRSCAIRSCAIWSCDSCASPCMPPSPSHLLPMLASLSLSPPPHACLPLPLTSSPCRPPSPSHLLPMHASLSLSPPPHAGLPLPLTSSPCRPPSPSHPPPHAGPCRHPSPSHLLPMQASLPPPSWPILKYFFCDVESCTMVSWHCKIHTINA